MPRNAIEIAESQNAFYELQGFPRVIGTIDGTHIKIQSPGGDRAEIYRNRKTYFSLNVQVVGDANLMIRDIVVRWPGSAHDSTMFNNSRLKMGFEGEFGNAILLGDGAYKNSRYMYTPFVNPITENQRRYNRSHKATRVKIENLFGVWKRRFPIIAYGCRLKLDHTINVIIATAVVHNIARSRGEPNPMAVNEGEIQQVLAEGDIPMLPLPANDEVDHRNVLVNTYFR